MSGDGVGGVCGAGERAGDRADGRAQLLTVQSAHGGGEEGQVSFGGGYCVLVG